MTNAWMVRAGRDAQYAQDFLAEKIVAIGWPDLGLVQPGETKAKLIQRYKQAYPDQSDGQVQTGAAQVLRFANEIHVGDDVVTYDRDLRVYFIGTITGDVEWRPNTLEELPQTRAVQWKHQAARDSLSAKSKSTLGAIQTLFALNKGVFDDLMAHAVAIGENLPVAPQVTTPANSTDAKELEQQIRSELLEKSDEAIEDRMSRLGWEQLQELVAGILRAMGYRTKVSPRGADRGVDIFASPDGLGLEEPRIFVEVKHRPATAMSAQDVRSFLGGRSPNDRCLYISTGGFTKDARYEADRSSIPLQLLSLVELRRLYVDYYEQLDEATRSLIPLKRVYVMAD